MTSLRATVVGFGAVLLWALLALLTVLAGPVPPFQLAAMCLTVGALIGLVWLLLGGGSARLRGVRPVVWLVGIAGIFGYHLAYFTALANAPAAQASLIAYLWPLLIVLMSGLLPGERLRPLHLAGAALALAGAVLVLAGPGLAAATGSRLGYAAAVACALIWSSYSVASRRLGAAPTETVAVFCFGSAVLAALAHVVLEPTVWPADARAWAAVIALGLGPVGLAFYLWDIGVKNGDIQVLGTASYAAPLLSTVVLVMAGEAEPSASLIAAAILIAGGAALAAHASRRPAGPVDASRAGSDPASASPVSAGPKGARSLP